eukprot:351874-Pyramimonas_sp.AAC.1
MEFLRNSLDLRSSRVSARCDAASRAAKKPHGSPPRGMPSAPMNFSFGALLTMHRPCALFGQTASKLV